MLGPVGKTDQCQRFSRTFFALRLIDLGVQHRELCILQRRRPGQQIETLEDKSNLLVSNQGQGLLSCSETSIPSRRYRPELGRSRHPSMFMKVDLPLPLAPMIARNSPR